MEQVRSSILNLVGIFFESQCQHRPTDSTMSPEMIKEVHTFRSTVSITVLESHYLSLWHYGTSHISCDVPCSIKGLVSIPHCSSLVAY